MGCEMLDSYSRYAIIVLISCRNWRAGHRKNADAMRAKRRVVRFSLLFGVVFYYVLKEKTMVRAEKNG